MEILFYYNEKIIKVESEKEKKMKEICNIFKYKMNLLTINLYFLYEGNEINQELTLIEQINESDLGKNSIKIFVFERNNIISIIYRINKDEKTIRIFGETFVNNNRNICSIFYNCERYDLTEYICVENYESELLEIKLVGIKEVKNMEGLFEYCTSLISLPDISEWNTDNVINMRCLFYGCISLYSPRDNIINKKSSEVDDLLEASKKTNYNKINNSFDNYPQIKGKNKNKEILFFSRYTQSFYNISKWNIKNVTDISFIFGRCENLELLPEISEWNIENVKNISGIFACCKKLKVAPNISKWDIKNCNDISLIFHGCFSLKSVPDLSGWNTENVVKANNMFCYCKSLESVPYIFNITNKVTNIEYFFAYCDNLCKAPDNMSNWNTKNVINMIYLFGECPNLEYAPDMSKWETGNVTNMNFFLRVAKN